MTGKVRFDKSLADMGHLLVGAAIMAMVPAVVIGLPVGWLGSAAWGWLAFLVTAALGWLTILAAAVREIGHHEGTPEGDSDERGYRHGTWTWLDSERRKRVVIDYDHGRQHGQEERFHADEKIASREFYLDGVKHGHCRDWWPDGQLRCQTHYHKGRLHGPIAAYAPDGTQQVEGQFVEGQAHGTWRWWRDDGNLRIEAHYVHGTPHGQWVEWNEGGQVVRQSEFVAGIQRARGRQFFVDRLREKTSDADLRPPVEEKRSISWFTIALIGGAVLLIGRDGYLAVPLAILMAVIAIHELGHFLMAKLVGIPIESFRIGVGPTLVQYHWRTTRYELGLIPVMGYVSEYQLRPEEWLYAHRRVGQAPQLAESQLAAAPLEVDAEQKRMAGSELLHPIRRIPYYLGGVTFNFLAAAIVVWLAASLSSSPSGTVSADARHPLVAVQRTAEFSWMMVAHTPQLLAPMFQSQSYTEYRPGAVAFMKDSAKRAAERVSEAEQQPDKAIEYEARQRGRQELFIMFASINLVLVWFNLLPIPPLDGFHVTCAVGEILIGRRWMEAVRRPLKALGVIIILLLIFISVFFVLRDLLPH